MPRRPWRFWVGIAIAAFAAVVWGAILGSSMFSFDCVRPWGSLQAKAGFVRLHLTEYPNVLGPFGPRTMGPSETRWERQRPIRLRWLVSSEVPAQDRQRYYLDAEMDVNPGPVPGSWGSIFTPAVTGLPGVLRIERVPWDTMSEFAIWPFALLPTIVSTALMIGGIRKRRRALAGKCPACAYDRNGISRGSPCPECGKRVSP